MARSGTTDNIQTITISQSPEAAFNFIAPRRPRYRLPEVVPRPSQVPRGTTSITLTHSQTPSQPSQMVNKMCAVQGYLRL